jgi:hypothetical protein
MYYTDTARQGGLRMKREPERAFAGRPIDEEER